MDTRLPVRHGDSCALAHAQSSNNHCVCGTGVLRGVVYPPEWRGSRSHAGSLGEGTQFYFTVPLVEASAPENMLDTEDFAVLHEKRVLARNSARRWLQHCPAARKSAPGLAVRLLEKMGHGVTLAKNGKEALERLARQSFDLILMDIQMPVMGGVEATKRIREGEAGADRRTPILAMTARALKGDREKYLGAGMDGYISKPIHTDLLRAEVARLTSQNHSVARFDFRRRNEDRMTTRIDIQDLLGRVENDRELLKDLVDIFRSDLPQYLAALEQAVYDRDSAEVARTAHSLKGMFANLAAPRAASAAAHLEALGREANAKGLAAALADLNQEVSGLLPELEAVATETRT